MLIKVANQNRSCYETRTTVTKSISGLKNLRFCTISFEFGCILIYCGKKKDGRHLSAEVRMSNILLNAQFKYFNDSCATQLPQFLCFAPFRLLDTFRLNLSTLFE